MSKIKPYQILNLRGRDIVVRKCRCKGTITAAVGSRSSKENEILFCKVCKKIIQDYVCNFKMDMVVLDVLENRVREITMFDKVVEEFLGCTPEEYLEHVKRDSRLYEKLEEAAHGMFVNAEMGINPRGYIEVKSCVIQSNEQAISLIGIITRKLCVTGENK